MKQQINTRHEKENQNWGATPLVGHPSGRLHPLAGYTLWQAIPSGRLPKNKKGKLNYTVT